MEKTFLYSNDGDEIQLNGITVQEFRNAQSVFK